MLDLGFLQPIRRIVSNLPKNRQNLFFSATMPTEIGKLASELLKNPVQVSVTPQATTVEKISQQILFVEQQRKRQLLAELFAEPKIRRAIVFTRTKRGADRVAKYLEQAGVTASAIHGDKSQGQRERALAAFKAGGARALVATDIAARGIDVDGVTHVVNFELPNVPEAYVHRIGRTARAGAEGAAISLCSDDERPLLKDIQKLTRQTIPAFDRRNDRHLGAMAAVDEKVSPEPRQRSGGQNHRGGGGGGGGGRNGGKSRNGGGSNANAGGQASHANAPRKPEDAGSRPPRRRNRNPHAVKAPGMSQGSGGGQRNGAGGGNGQQRWRPAVD